MGLFRFDRFVCGLVGLMTVVSVSFLGLRLLSFNLRVRMWASVGLVLFGWFQGLNLTLVWVFDGNFP